MIKAPGEKVVWTHPVPPMPHHIQKPCPWCMQIGCKHVLTKYGHVWCTCGPCGASGFYTWFNWFKARLFHGMCRSCRTPRTLVSQDLRSTDFNTAQPNILCLGCYHAQHEVFCAQYDGCKQWEGVTLYLVAGALERMQP